MSWRDWVAEIVETAFRLVPVPVRTGIRVVGNPDRMSPIFLTGNYDLTVRRVLRALRGLDAYLVVANSRGVNVWCASSGGHLGTHQVVTALKVARLEEKVVHREVIVPQLAATGVEAKEVRRRTGWIVRFGPADANDIPTYLAAGKNKTQAMRAVRFNLRQRFEMAATWATPISLIAGIVAWYVHHLVSAVALVWLLALAVFFFYDRLPLSDRKRQAVFAFAALAAVICTLVLTGLPTPAAIAGWSFSALAVLGLLTFDYAGSSPTAPAGLFEEKDFRVALDIDRCTGAYNCWAVCPEAVFEKRTEIHKVAIARPERCIRCGACLVQCPQDALSFEAPDGRRVGPEVIRRFKLNMLGKRATRIEDGSLCSCTARAHSSRGTARKIARSGAVVVGVDLPQYLRNLAASRDGCHYVIAEIEDMSERLQRDFHFTGYQSPILAGIGAGGTLVYAALAQSPAATIGGAISVDPAPALGTKVPLCAGAEATAAGGGGFAYAGQPKLAGWWRVSVATPLPPALATVVERSSGNIADVRGQPLERLLALVRGALPTPTRPNLPGTLADLPLTELPALRPGPAMAVIYSGDGGWRDIDKQIGEVLARKGMPVVGVDSLRYFWHAKTSTEIAGQLSQIIDHYGTKWGTAKVVLIGYSFGAGILPFAVNQLPAQERTRIVQVSLLGLETRAEFQVKLSGWFGGEPGPGAPAVLPEILRQPRSLFQCFYGEKEEDTLCTAPALAGIEIIRTGGGHHFGGDYTALAQKILDGAERRLNAGQS